ncbi:hypothetical protein [Caulobacter sp. DWR2-3-1b2]|uniref:hypothetical protein n=1 Tax=unclassified Caulobacter TaxID=2648921 RepID=UPI0019CECFB0|nr:hypothetical protein [Caulobacter sp.]
MAPLSGLTILAPGLTNRVGHEHEYTLMVARAAISRGATVRVICPPPTEELGLPGETLAVLPTRRAPIPDRSLATRVRARLLPLRERLERMRYERLFARSGPTLWLVHTAPYDEIARIALAFSRFGKGRLAVILRYDHYDDPAAVEAVRRALAPASDPRIALFADSETLRTLLAPLAPAEIRLAPIPVQAASGVAPKPRIVGFFGAMRRQKGFQHLPGLFAAALSADPTLSFVVQVYGHPDDAPDPEIARALAALRAAPRITLLEAPLSSQEFHIALAGCAVLLTPYDPVIYRAGTSGIFAAGLAVGCAVVGPLDGWMGDEAARVGLTRYFPADFTDLAAAAQILTDAAGVGASPFVPTKAEADWIGFNSAESLVTQLGL